jgi:hypothetical protein
VISLFSRGNSEKQSTTQTTGELTLKIWSFPRERIMETNKIGIDGTVEKRRIGEGRAGNDNPNENEEKEKTEKKTK